MSSDSGPPNDSELSFLGRASERLSDLIAAQTEELFAAEDVQIPVKSCSLMEALAACEPASASDLAHRMGRSHQIIMQKLPKLIDLGFVDREVDAHDKRRYVLRLTPAGRDQLERLARVTPAIAAAYRSIEAEIGPVYAQIFAMIDQLEERSIGKRVKG